MGGGGGGGTNAWVYIYTHTHHYRVTENSPVLLYKKVFIWNTLPHHSWPWSRDEFQLKEQKSALTGGD